MNNLFLFTGEESYLIRDLMQTWKKAFIAKHTDMNLIVIDADETSIGRIMTDIEAAPFLGEKRLIFIHGLPLTTKEKKSGEKGKKDYDKQLVKLASSFENIPDTSVVVFVQSKPDKRLSFYKTLAKQADVKEFNHLKGGELINWIKKFVKANGSKIDTITTEYFIMLAGDNLWKLSQEINKMTTYKPGETISRSLIDLSVIPTAEANIFHLTDALGARNHKKAIQNLHKCMAAGENLRPTFYMIVRQFRLLINIKGYINKNPNATPSHVASSLKIHPFVARNTFGQLKHFNLDELKKMYKDLLNIDLALKTSKLHITTDNQDDLALEIERFILSYR